MPTPPSVSIRQARHFISPTANTAWHVGSTFVMSLAFLILIHRHFVRTYTHRMGRAALLAQDTVELPSRLFCRYLSLENQGSRWCAKQTTRRGSGAHHAGAAGFGPRVHFRQEVDTFRYPIKMHCTRWSQYLLRNMAEGSQAGALNFPVSQTRVTRLFRLYWLYTYFSSARPAEFTYIWQL